MAFTPGGRADKFGNHYESLWIANRLLDILSENKFRSVTIEAIGQLEDGVDLWVEDFEGNRVAEQCKARNGSNEKWTVSDLKSVIKKIPVHVSRERNNKFRLVSPLPFTLLDDLCIDAQMSADSEEYYSGIVLRSKDKIKIYQDFCKTLGLNHDNQNDRVKAHFYLQHFNVEFYSGTDKTLDDLKQKAILMFTGNPETLVSLLRSYIIDEKMLGKQIYSENLLTYLAKNEIYPRMKIDDHRLSVTLNSLKSNFNDSISNILISNNLIKRKETEECFKLLDLSDVVILHGEAGRGKSGVLYEFIRLLDENNISCVPIRLDRNIPRGSSRAFGLQLGLPDSPAICLAGFSGNRKAVLILDQLDAIRWTSENSLESIIVCKQLIKEALAYNKFEGGNLKIVIVCRTFDLENDPEIKNWLLNKNNDQQFRKLEVKELEDNEVCNIVGPKNKLLSKAQINILKNPQNLYMWLELKSEEGMTFVSTAELMKLFWKYKRSIIEKAGVSSEQLNAILSKTTTYMERKGEISIPARVLDGLSSVAVEALLSHSILQNQGERIAFCHQSYLDYLIADSVLSKIDNGGSILSWLGDKSEQTLYRRQQLSIFLYLLIKESQSDFLKVAREILFSATVRFHIKHLVFEVFSQVCIVNEDSFLFLDELILSEEWRDHVLKRSVQGNPVLVGHLVNNGVILNWIQSTDKNSVSSALQLLSSVVIEAPQVIEAVLRKSYDESFISKEQAFGCLSYQIADDTDSLFEFRLNLIKNGFQLRFIDWNDLATRNPSFAIRIIKLLAEIESDKDSIGLSAYDRKMYDHDLKPIFKIAESKFDEIWNVFFDFSADVVKKHDAKELHSRYDSFDIEKKYSDRRSHLDKFSDLCVLLLIESGKKMAELYPAELFLRFENKAKEKIILSDNVLSLIYLSLPINYADFVVNWLLENDHRFSLGKDFERPKWILASDLIKKFSGDCNLELFNKLEGVLYSFTPRGKDFRRDFEYYIKASRNGYFFPAWGVAQYFLLPSLDKDRTSMRTKELINVLNRKFDKYPKSRFFRCLNGSGGFVGSKIESNISKISDKSWIEIITNAKTKKRHDHSTWVQVDANTIHVSSHEMFSRSLERAAKSEPERFCRIFDSLPDQINSSYVSSMIEALSQVKSEKPSEEWEMASVVHVEIFWKKFRHLRFEREVARSFCSLFTRRAGEDWPKWMIEDLFELAIKHEDPIVEKLNVWSEGETYNNASARTLHSTAINSVRGSAVEAIGDLLWKNNNLVSLVEDNIEKILNDEHLSIMIAIHSITLPMINIDSAKALDWFVRSSSKDVRVTCSRESIEFFNYMIGTKEERLISLIRKMLTSDEEEVVEMASEMVVFYSHCYSGIFRDELEQVIKRDFVCKKGAVKALKNLVRNDKYAFDARNLLSNYFNDTDKEIRDMSSRIFYEDDFLNTPENLDLAIGYVNSLAFQDGDTQLFHCLENYRGNLVKFSELILIACEQLLSCNKAPNEDYSKYYEYKNFVTLLIRLYDQTGVDSKLRERCLDVWDMFFKENIDMSRDITNKISR